MWRQPAPFPHVLLAPSFAQESVRSSQRHQSSSGIVLRCQPFGDRAAKSTDPTVFLDHAHHGILTKAFR
jgi:hypothetical protein